MPNYAAERPLAEKKYRAEGIPNAPGKAQPGQHRPMGPPKLRAIFILRHWLCYLVQPRWSAKVWKSVAW